MFIRLPQILRDFYRASQFVGSHRTILLILSIFTPSELLNDMS